MFNMGDISPQTIFDVSSFILGVILWLKVRKDTKGRSMRWCTNFMTVILIPCIVFAFTGFSDIPELEDIASNCYSKEQLFSTVGSYYFVQIYDVFSTLIMGTMLVRAYTKYKKLKKEVQDKSKESHDNKTE